MNHHFDVIIVGAGAAGLMCAIEAGKRGRKVVVLEHNDKVGRKIRISGGGRCNFTNLHASPQNYLSENLHFFISPLSRYTPGDFLRLIHRYGIKFHEKKLGQLFCDESAQQVIDLLVKEIQASGGTIRTSTHVHAVHKEDGFRLLTTQGELTSASLVIATGGLSLPTLGATDFGYRIARQFGLKTTVCKPGLVPLTWGKKELALFKDISGISFDCIARIGKVAFRENLLFTHKGLSGPAILQISSYWKPGDTITVDLLPEIDIAGEFERLAKSTAEMRTLLGRFLPKRFAEVFCQHYLHSQPINRYSSKQLEAAAQLLHNWPVLPSGTEGYAKAEVTVGGIDTAELSSKTLESKKIPGLFFVGEVVDVTGWLGGFNFQWAWASGFAAGQYV